MVYLKLEICTILAKAVSTIRFDRDLNKLISVWIMFTFFYKLLKNKKITILFVLIVVYLFDLFILVSSPGMIIRATDGPLERLELSTLWTAIYACSVNIVLLCYFSPEKILQSMHFYLLHSLEIFRPRD